jgi:hypothetical protein
MGHVRLVMLHSGMLAHQLGVLFQLVHRAEDHLVQDLSLVDGNEAHNLATLDGDLRRMKTHLVGHMDAHRPLRLLRVRGAAEGGLLGLRIVETFAGVRFFVMAERGACRCCNGCCC